MKSVDATGALTACLEGDILIADRVSDKGVFVCQVKQ